MNELLTVVFHFRRADGTTVNRSVSYEECMDLVTYADRAYVWAKETKGSVTITDPTGRTVSLQQLQRELEEVYKNREYEDIFYEED